MKKPMERRPRMKYRLPSKNLFDPSQIEESTVYSSIPLHVYRRRVASFSKSGGLNNALTLYFADTCINKYFLQYVVYVCVMCIVTGM